jgi:hypothetical protein
MSGFKFGQIISYDLRRFMVCEVPKDEDPDLLCMWDTEFLYRTLWDAEQSKELEFYSEGIADCD